MDYDPLDSQGDPFKPPAIPIEVQCVHCGREYESYLIEWRVETDADGTPHGFWCCPTPGCGGHGFGFDILPTDPEYRDEHGGWVWDDDEELDELDFSEEGELDDVFETLESEEDAADSRERAPEEGDEPPY